MKITITEALAEIKLCEKKLQKKWEIINGNTHRYLHVKDPFETDGGSKEAMKRELQSVHDLEVRIVRIREAIQKINTETIVTIGENSKSIAGWLVWKRDIEPNQKKFYSDIMTKLKLAMDKDSNNPPAYKDEEGKVHLAKMELNFDYAQMLALQQKLSDITEALDGQLSLKNATIVVEF